MVMRWIVLLMLLVFTVFSIVGTTQPIFVHDLTEDDQTGKVTVTFFMIQMTKTTLTAPAFTVPAGNYSRLNYASCGAFKSSMRASEAFAISGSVCGFFALLSSCVQCLFRLKMKLCIFVFTIFAFVSEFLCIIVVGSAYTTTFCKNNYTTNSSAIVFKSVGYKLASGFVLHVVAVLGFAVCVILAPFTQQLWCGSC
ncbi:hypothetical protein STCU_01036 [Strigomonas culicis]|uniref:Amastin-like surface protein-like protein n=1 Tax=Strigomonas culicis TaxID=28005 RepID=S9V3Z6_9TRYP|nr:hypothetical protein STCU_01036 [Strigomonas culicis]|eukprot:EPY35638.1 hypothetical protein STCU_01036 [Strigomonas culicis]